MDGDAGNPGNRKQKGAIVARVAINVDHVATLRQARLAREPDPVTAAALAELAGAQGIVVHLREDRRHIQDRDLEILRRTVKTRLNLEMASTPEMVRIALDTRPEVVTLVPEKRQELTTEGGLDVLLHYDSLQEAVNRLRAGGILVSVFINADSHQIQAAHGLQADCVELHTGTFAEAGSAARMQEELARLHTAAGLARQLGLTVHAGHGVDYRNILLLRGITAVEEFSIGHAVMARAILVGMERAVSEMIALVNG
jgi:pyridoxine 5-phosphate synthase